LSPEIKDKLRLLFSGSKNPFFNKKHSEEFKKWLNSRRKSSGNPMHGKPFSREFLWNQRKDKTKKKNHQSKSVVLTNIHTSDQKFYDCQI
jgi:hypothetical protein